MSTRWVLAFQAAILNARLFKLATNPKRRRFNGSADQCDLHREQSIRSWRCKQGQCATCKIPQATYLGRCKKCGERLMGWVCEQCQAAETDQRLVEAVHELGGKVLCISCEADRRTRSAECI